MNTTQAWRRAAGLCIDCGLAAAAKGGRCEEHYARALAAVRRHEGTIRPQPPRLRWSREAIITALRTRLEGPVTVPEYRRFSTGHTDLPCERTITKYFHGWGEAMSHAFPGESRLARPIAGRKDGM